MLIRNLPPNDKAKFRALAEAVNMPWETMENLTLTEVDDWMRAYEEDADARIERMQRRLALEREISGIAHSVCDKYPHLTLGKVEYFLHGEVRTRFKAAMRELEEMAKVPLITRGRQPWHQAVELELQREHWLKGCSVDDIVNAVLARDTAYPPGPVREYTKYILDTASGVR